MKTHTLIVILLLGFLFGCSKSNPPEDFYITTLTSGSWKIDFFSVYETENNALIFDGYTFRFTADGNVRASKNETSVNGHWWITHGNYISFLRLDFNSTDDFVDLNRTWSYLGNGFDEISLRRDIVESTVFRDLQKTNRIKAI